MTATTTTQGQVPKSSYTFIKLQLVAVCCLAFWLLVVSPPNYFRHNNDFSPPARTPLISSSSKIDRDSRLFQSSFQRLGGTAQGDLAMLAETSPTMFGEVTEGTNYTRVPTPTLSANTTLGVDISDEVIRWVIKWPDRDFSKTKMLPISEGSSWSNSEDEVKRHVIFNRVGKCGSRSVLTLLKSLAESNHFYLISSQTFNEKRITQQNQGKLVSILNTIESPFIYQRHLHFVNFTKFDSRQPTYINIIRDPLERAVSHYYFIRFGDEKKQDRLFSQNSTDPRKFMSYEECIKRKLPECIGNRAFYIIPFFCGQLPKCRSPTEWAYRRAIENVKKHYLAVGILEELQDSLQVFQKVLPNMFSGALDTFLKFEQIAHQNRSSVGVTQYKQKPSPKTALYVKNVLMKYEYQFYNWIKDRLHRQMDELGLQAYHLSYR